MYFYILYTLLKIKLLLTNVKMKTSHTDIIPNFVLRQDLSFTENIILNYAIVTKDKAKTIWLSMNFIARSAAQKAFASLKNKYNILTVYHDGSISIKYTFSPNLTEYTLNNRTWRPKKSLVELKEPSIQTP